MPRRRLAPFVAVALAAAGLLSATSPLFAYTIDGQLDPEYGAPTLVQTLQTELNQGQIAGDNTLGDIDFANGSELDAAWARISGDTLHLFVGGNLALVLNQQQNGSIGHLLDLFIDSAPGGFGSLAVGPGHPLNGFTFDNGFEPDYWFEFRGDADQNGADWFAYRGVLPPGGTGEPALLGVTSAGPPGTLLGGTNPHGVRVTIDNRNTAGVPFGCNASSGAGVTRGIEWSIPLAAIGGADGCIRITAIVRTQGATTSPVSNQVLAPLPDGTCSPGPASSVNLANHAGDQFFEVCPTPTGVPDGPGATGWSLSLLGANPLRGETVRLAFDLAATGGSARLSVHDARGRAVRTLRLNGSSGVAEVSLRGLAPGMYWARLSLEGRTLARPFSLLP
jgi:hypothetical protein